MLQHTIDITDLEFVMRIGTYAREVGINRVTGWIIEERTRLTDELGRNPLRHEIAHALQNTYYANQFAVSPNHAQAFNLDIRETTSV